jgi:hypothetical protein
MANSVGGNYDPWSGGAGMLGAGLGSLFGGYNNPSDSAMKYLNQIPDQLKQYFMPYINAGQGALPDLQKQFGQLSNDPGGRINQIGQSYQQSPGFQFQLQQALQGANHAAAAGGMAGSPQHQQQNMGLATNLANQNYNQYLQNALGQYDVGLQGQQHIYDVGAQAGMGLGENLASVLGAQANYAYEGQNAQNQHDQGIWGSIFGGGGQMASQLPWGQIASAMGL